MSRIPCLWIALCLFAITTSGNTVEPVEILNLPGSGTDPEKIDYADIPIISGMHAVINPASPGPDTGKIDLVDIHHLRLQLHNYLIRFDNRFWCIWSDGPAIEDRPGQEIKYSTSNDGIDWDTPKSLTGRVDEPYAYIARGLWLREGHLLALGAHYKGKGAFGADKELQLQAFRWDRSTKTWKFKGKLYDNAINNFPPQKLSDGNWILTRRDARFNVSVLIGGRASLDDWKSFPVIVGRDKNTKFRPDEPIFWSLPDRSLFALYRDNGGSRRLFHSLSTDLGRSWGTPVITNFPNATSKLFALQTSRGFRVLILNANPKTGRRELHIAISKDGQEFTRLARLDIPSPPELTGKIKRLQHKFSAGIASLQYPHAIEHDGKLIIAFSRLKTQTEIFHIPLDSIAALLNE